MKKVFLAAAGAFALIPGLTVIATGIEVPPGYQVFFGGVIEFFGGLTILLLFVMKATIRTWSQSKVVRRSVKLGVAAFVLLLLYNPFFAHCVVKSEVQGVVYFPLVASGNLETMITRAGTRQAALNLYGRDAIQSAIEEVPDYYKSITTSALLLVYMAAFTMLTVSSGIPGVFLK